MRNTDLHIAVPLKTTFLPFVLLFLANACFAQTIPTASKYLGQQVPGISPRIFQLQVTPGLAAAERIAITSDNKEIYYGELDNWPSTVQRIKYYKYLGTSWQGPFVAFEGYVAPSLSANDLYISFKKEDGGLTNPKTLGQQVNTPNPNWEACPYVTKDNKYLFFMRGGNALSSYFIYWVAIDNLIDSLRHTNFTPYVKYSLQNQTFSTGRSNSFAISDSSFIDDDGNHTLTLTASLGNGNPLPEWLNFDPNSGAFTGTPTEPGSFIVKVTATDPAVVTARASFTLLVNDASGMDAQALQQKVQIFPNPAKDKITVSFGGTLFDRAVIQVTNLVGKRVFYGNFNANSVAEINLLGNPKGIYLLELVIDGVVMKKKIFLD